MPFLDSCIYSLIIIRMSAVKKRKVDSECRVFNTEWTSKYFVTHVGSKAVCLICQNAISVFKEYNIRDIFRRSMPTMPPTYRRGRGNKGP